MDKVLAEIYYDTKNPASFSPMGKLYVAAKTRLPSITLKQVEEWLSDQDAHTLHKRVRHKFKRKPIIAHEVDETWQIDLADVSSRANDNAGVKFIFVAIDVLSRYVFLEPMLNKSAASVVQVMETIFSRHKRIPRKIQTDQGKEFLNSSVTRLAKKHKIKHFTATGDDAKCALAERFIRTMREKITKYLTATSQLNYIDYIQFLADNYNNTIHSRLKMKPAEVNDKTREQAFDNLYGEYYRPPVAKQMSVPKFASGDTVRIARKKEVFEKKSESPNFTRELFKVKDTKVNPHITTYTLEDMDGEVITSIFYPSEMLKAKIKDKWEIEDILDTKISKGIKYGLVKWMGYPAKFNSWVKI